MPIPTILVLGSTGAIGGAVISLLIPDHTDGSLRLIATARRSDAADCFERLGVECRLLDLDHAEHQIGATPRRFARRGPHLPADELRVKMLAQSKAVTDASNQADVSHTEHLRRPRQSDHHDRSSQLASDERGVPRPHGD